MAGALLLAGASGLVGSQVLQRALADGWQVIAPCRRPLAVSHPRLRVLVHPLEHAHQDQQLAQRLAQAIDAPLAGYLCCLGTTIKTAGTREAFRAVDHDLVLALARIAHAEGARQATMVSSVGADARSGNFYLAVKGGAEDALAKIGFERVDLLRPGLLIGARSELRAGEALAQRWMPKVDWLLAGPLARYRSVRAETVAAAAVALQGEAEPGRFVHEYADLLRLAGSH